MTTNASGGDLEPQYSETTERFGVLRLVVDVDARGVRVRLAPIQHSPRRLPADEIRAVRATTYDPARYAGWHWGVRRTPGAVVYRLRGDRGVEIVGSDGKRWFVGSQRPAELASAVERVASTE